MLPLSDGLRSREFPVVNVALIAANFAVWLLYEVPHLNEAVFRWSIYPCGVDNACRPPEPTALTWLTSMFLHGSWDHILGNMLFLAIFGKNVEDAYGHLRYLLLYIAGGFVAGMTQVAVTLLLGSAADARVPTLGASGAIAAVLGAYLVLYPDSRIRTLVVFVIIRIPAWIYLGGWFIYQLVSAHFSLVSTSPHAGGVAFFAHIGGFLFGMAVTSQLLGRRRIAPRDDPRMAATPAW